MRNKVESEEEMIKNIPEFAMIKSRDNDEADMELQISQEKKKIVHLKEEIFIQNLTKIELLRKNYQQREQLKVKI